MITDLGNNERMEHRLGMENMPHVRDALNAGPNIRPLVLDRGIGISTPMSTYRGGMMHHTLRYGKHDRLRVFVYGDITENHSNKRIYVIANNGFIEGRQNEPLMQIMENFCIRSGLTWCGGLGIGGGVMMNVMRIMICVVFGLTLLQMAMNGYDPVILKDFGTDILTILILCADLFFTIISLFQGGVFRGWFAKSSGTSNQV